MISVAEAESIIFEKLYQATISDVDIHESVGLVLASNITADRDLPPFTRVTMDGIAINFATFKNGGREFAIEGVQAAGEPARTLSSPSHCIEVMTGAMLPQGTDTIVRYEDISIKDGRATIQTDEVAFHQNLHHQGQDARRESILLTPGIRLSAAEVAVLASVGIEKVSVYGLPVVAIVSTGNELVDIAAVPHPWQIRKSNGSALLAALRQLQIDAKLFHLPDNEQQLEKELESILHDHPVVMMSGGVSKGKFDFVPGVLAKLGIEKKFHQVSQRPGKPFWFGRSDRHTVFALPGNPVSTYMCFYRYIKPWLERSLHQTPLDSFAILSEDLKFKPPLTCFLQVKITNEKGRLVAMPDAGGGSGDFANLKDVDGFLELPLKGTEFKRGEVFRYFPFR
jgi:molybdopterin molybdotransferase